MGNIVRSFIDELVPGWAARRAIQRAAGRPQEPARERAGEIQMPVQVAMPAPHGRQDRGPYRPQPTPSHWRAPNM